MWISGRVVASHARGPGFAPEHSKQPTALKRQLFLEVFRKPDDPTLGPQWESGLGFL